MATASPFPTLISPTLIKLLFHCTSTKGQKASFRARRRPSVTITRGTDSTRISDLTGYTHSSNTNSPPGIKGRILHLQKQTGQLHPPKDTEALSKPPFRSVVCWGLTQQWRWVWWQQPQHPGFSTWVHMRISLLKPLQWFVLQTQARKRSSMPGLRFLWWHVKIQEDKRVFTAISWVRLPNQPITNE